MNPALRVTEDARHGPQVGSSDRRCDRSHGGHPCRAFTLLEVVIVLVLVVILSGLAYNALMRPMAARRLQLAADQIRAEWVRARNRAMANGQTYCFQCELGGTATCWWRMMIRRMTQEGWKGCWGRTRVFRDHRTFR